MPKIEVSKERLEKFEKVCKGFIKCCNASNKCTNPNKGLNKVSVSIAYLIEYPIDAERTGNALVSRFYGDYYECDCADCCDKNDKAFYNAYKRLSKFSDFAEVEGKSILLIDEF